MAATSDNERQSEIQNRLISLVHKAHSAPLPTDSVYRVVAREFDSILTARLTGISWLEIADVCGFPGRENRIRDAFSKERRRRERKEKVKTTVVPVKNGKEVMPASKPVSKSTQIQKSKIPLGGRIKEGSNEIVFENSFDIDAID